VDNSLAALAQPLLDHDHGAAPFHQERLPRLDQPVHILDPPFAGGRGQMIVS
jgi:hypothetical protein